MCLNGDEADNCKHTLKRCPQMHDYSWQTQKLDVFLPSVAAILALRYSDINRIFKDFLKIVGCGRVWKVFNEQSPRVPLWRAKRSAADQF